MQGKRPGVVAARTRGGEDVVAPRVVVREQARVEVAERDLHRARQRCEVEHVRRTFSACVPEGVGEHEPPLCVRVRDLDRLAVCGAQDVAGAERLAADEILRGRDDGEDADGRLQLGRGCRAGDHGRAAGHVALHVVHLQRRLQRDAAGVERDRLADETQHDVAACIRRVVAEND